MIITRYEGGIPYTEEIPDPDPRRLAAFEKFLDSIPEPCEHEHTITEVDNLGNEYTVCEDCEEEVEPEDDRSFYRDPETGRITW